MVVGLSILITIQHEILFVQMTTFMCYVHNRREERGCIPIPHPFSAITTSQEGQGSRLSPELLLKQFFQDMEIGIYIFTFIGSAFTAGMHCSI